MPTPFGIRRRIKRLLGMPVEGAKSTEPPVEKASLTVIGPTGGEQSCEAALGATVLAAAGSLKKPIASGCSDSTCGTCRIEVVEGADVLSEQVARERATLKENGYPTSLRLACRAELVKQGAVKVKAFELV